MPPLKTLFLLVAIVVFIVAALGVPSSRLNLVAAGLACVTASLLL